MTKNELYWEISVRKNHLKETDYQAIKHSEGVISESDYKPIKEQREAWREEINNFEAMIANGQFEEPVVEEYIPVFEEPVVEEDIPDFVEEETEEV